MLNIPKLTGEVIDSTWREYHSEVTLNDFIAAIANVGEALTGTALETDLARGLPVLSPKALCCVCIAFGFLLGAKHTETQQLERLAER